MEKTFLRIFLLASILYANHSVFADDHTWEGDKIYISYNMEHPDEFGFFEDIVTIYSEKPDDPDCENSITFHDASSYDNNHHYTPSNSIDLNSNNPIESIELSYFDINHGGWLTISETGYYDMVLYKTNEDGKEKITVTAHAHQPKPVLKTDNVTPTGFYYCEHCNKYFSDEAGTIQANEEDIDYTITTANTITNCDIVHSKKYIENRALIIENNGVKYDLLGRELYNH